MEISSDTDIKNIPTPPNQREYYLSFDSIYAGSLGLRVTPKGKKSFFVVYPALGRRRRLTLGIFPVMDLNQAKSAAEKLLQAASQGSPPLRRRVIPTTVRELWGEFCASGSGVKLSKTTLAEYSRIMERLVLPRLGRDLIQELTEIELKTFLAQITAPIMAERTRSLLNRLLRFAQQEGKLETNPTPKARVATTKSPQFLTHEQCALFFKTIAEDRSSEANVIRFIFLTAQSPKKVLRLRWDDLGSEVWVIRADLPLPLSGPANAILRAQKSAAQQSEFVFLNTKGRPLSNIRPYLNIISRKLKMRISTQIIRRTVERLLAQNRIRPDAIARLFDRRSHFRTNHVATFDYAAEMKEVVELLAKIYEDFIRPPEEPKTKGKVIQLFPR